VSLAQPQQHRIQLAQGSVRRQQIEPGIVARLDQRRGRNVARKQAAGLPLALPLEAQAQEDEDYAGASYKTETEVAVGRAASDSGGSATGAPELDICFADEASKLLRELASRCEEVAQLVEDSKLGPARKAGCCIM
jgi:hypothetical protein